MARGVFDLKWHCEGYVPWTRQTMVHQGMSKQNWMACTCWPGTLHHILLSWNGNRSMDCQLWNLSFKVPRHLWRNCCHSKLDLKPHCCTVFSDFNDSNWDFLDIPDVWGHLCCSPVLRLDMRPGNEGAPDRGGGEDAGAQSSALQVLGEKLSDSWQKPISLK